MRSLLFVGLLVGSVGLTACTPHATSTIWARAPDAWPRLRDRLAGVWHGTTGEGGAVDVTYAPIAGGSALAETFGGPTRATMTLFHPDHGGLVATHYCAQGNQPRLRAVAVEPDALRFAEADITDLDPEESHLVELDLEFGAEGFDRVEDYRGPDGAVERTRWHFVRAKPL
ncbi:MAG: hypothetical protein U0414_07320 [Polyangiaceae bacterium]